MNTLNPLYFLFDIMRSFMDFLGSFKVFGVSYMMWIIGFILISMVASVFWKGARG